MAALFFASESICLSRQLTDGFNIPPTNHFANGRFHSSTFFHSLNQSRFFACSAQNCSRFSIACLLKLTSFFPSNVSFSVSSYPFDNSLNFGLDIYRDRSKNNFKSIV